MGASRTTERPNELPDWRQRSTDDLPTPMVGTGLGLFGLRESPFVDRNDERDRIWQTLRDVFDDDALRLVVVAGNSGTGKSRLARWVARRADEVGAATVLKSLHTSSGGEGRSEGLAGLVLRAVRGWRLDRDELYHHLVETLPKLEQHTDLREVDARALTELVFPTDSSDTDIDGPHYEFDSSRQKYTVVTRLIRRVATRRTPLLWIDDLQWGPDALGLVEYLLQQRNPPPVLVVSTLRTDIVAGRDELAERIEPLEDDETTHRLDLQPLAGDDHRLLIDRLLRLRPKLGDRIAERTEGNPLFAHQLIDDLVTRQQLEPTPGGFDTDRDGDLELPDDIHQLWKRRMRRMLRESFREQADTVGQIVELAAILGQHVDAGEWHAVCQIAELQIPPHLVDELADRGLAERTDDGWTFTHGMFVDSLVRFARQEGRYRDHHRMCATMLSRHYPNRRKQTARRRAEHWFEADQLDSALEALRQEYRRLRDVGDPDRLEQLLKRWHQVLERLDADPTSHPRLEYKLGRLKVQFERGNHDSRLLKRQKRLLQESLRAEYWELSARCAQAIAIFHRVFGELSASRRYFEEALEYARRTDNPRLMAHTLTTLGWDIFFEGDYETAERLTRRAIDRLPDQKGNARRMRARLHIGWILLHRAERDTAETIFEEVTETARHYGFRPIERDAITGLGDLARYRGNLDAARRFDRHQWNLAHEIESPTTMLTARMNLAQTELAAGRFDRVQDYLDVPVDLVSDELLSSPPYGPLRKCIRFGLWAGLEKWSPFDKRLESYRQTWPEEAPTTRDYPWLLECAADYCLQADKPDRARQVLRLAATLWRRLEDDEAVSRVQEKMP